MLLLAAANDGIKALGIGATVILFFVWLLFLIVVATIIGVLQQLWWRAATVGDQGAVKAIGWGWRTARQEF